MVATQIANRDAIDNIQPIQPQFAVPPARIPRVRGFERVDISVLNTADKRRPATPPYFPWDKFAGMGDIQVVTRANQPGVCVEKPTGFRTKISIVPFLISRTDILGPKVPIEQPERQRLHENCRVIPDKMHIRSFGHNNVAIQHLLCV
ncbi:hypothetical protein FGG08_000914 [Glutinoglossum americanum]|uniref:Uncharacterized protein n=1 Tax=Glutinoglossum americanum TaxID=1670608 RepID=A0A9P8IHL1_9PEZI|nr:hypothetical protein FGG08_000914 [Glutinoglossum americanum]